MASRFYSLMFVALTGILGMVSTPDVAFMTAQTQSVQDRKAEADRLLSVGNQQFQISQFELAMQSWLKSFQIYQEIHYLQGECNLLVKLGIAQRNLGNYVKAIEYEQQALTLAEEIKDRQNQGKALGVLGIAYGNLGNYSKTINYEQKWLEIALETKDRKSESAALANLSIAYRNLGNFDQANEYTLQLLAISREIKDRKGEFSALNTLGNISATILDLDRAIVYYNQALEIARDLGDKQGEGDALGNLGISYNFLSNYPKAIEYYQQHLEIAREIKDKEGEGISLNNIGDMLANQKQTELAILYYKQCINLRESIRKDIRQLDKQDRKLYLNSVTGSYQRLAELLLKQGRIIEALQVLDLLKVQELDDYLKNIKGNDRTSQGLRLLEPEKAVSDKLLAISFEQIPELNHQLANQIQQLPKSEIDKPPEYLQNLPQGTALLYPLILEDRLEIILFAANSPAIHHTVNIKKADLEERIGQFYADFQDSNSLDVKESSKMFYDFLIKPIEEDLIQIKANTILFAPDGKLRYIPITALYDGKQWLVEKYRINNLIAYSLFDQNSKPQSNPSIFAGAFGNGNKGNTEFKPLPATITEVNSIKSSFPNTTEITEQNFTAEASKSKAVGNTIIHLATHALFQSGSPLNSYILFGDGGKVTLSAISDWNLKNVDLVVLSACQTGLGTSSNGAEILGFGYQVQKAGAKASIASLWTVSDGGTQLLMQAFYENLRKSNPSLSTSLREAQLSMIHRSIKNGEPNFNHPYYWSAFILIGNGL